jgi:hypothetical protein
MLFGPGLKRDYVVALSSFDCLRHFTSVNVG